MSSIATIFGGAASAGSLSTEPLVGVEADYSTDPLLLGTNSGPETHEALLFNVPFRFDTDGSEYALLPRARFGNSSGYDSLASNYAYLDATAQFTSEVDLLTLQASIGRDSSLYYAGELSNRLGVRRDTASAFVNWDRQLTERLEFQPGLSWTQVRYDQGVNALSDLFDYRYVNPTSTLAYKISERDTLKLIDGAGSYHALNGQTQSDDANLQLGFDRDLTELWKLSTSLGYSRSTNRANLGFGSIESTQGGAVYNASLFRSGEHSTFGVIISRAIKPTGFAYSSLQESADLSANYDKSERWTFTARASWKKNLDPVFGGLGTTTRRYYEADLSAVWHWTSEWVVTTSVSRLSQQYAYSIPGIPGINAASSNITLELSRQFLRTEL
jgi:hypothetical protein